MLSRNRPNIVVIHTHDTGRWLGCYGRRVVTPNIDRMAAEGMRFDNHFATAPQCSPSRASLLTGRYPHQVGMLGLAHLGWELQPGTTTLPGALAAVGYQSCLFGTQHEAREASTLGYEASFETTMPQRAEAVSRAFAAFLEARSADSDQRPFFASVGFWETHRPFDDDGAYEPSDPASVEVPPFLPDGPEVREDVAQFEGTVKAADAGVGVVLDALDRHSAGDDTIVVFTTDHGLAFPRAKGTLYDSGIGIALLARWPGVVPPRSSCDALTSNVDLLPTLCEIAGAPVAAGVEGTSLMPLLAGEGARGKDEVFAEMTWHDRYVPMRGVRTGSHKLVRNFEPGPAVYLPLDVHRSGSGQTVRAEWYAHGRPTEELYDVITDPGERRDLAGDPTARAVRYRLRARLDAWMRRTDDPLLRGRVPGRAVPEWREEESPWPPESA